MRRKLYRRMVALGLSLLMVMIIVMPTQAADVGAEEMKGDLVETIALIKELYPEAVIEVKDGVINVATLGMDTVQTRAASEYAPDGGSYRSFVKPWYVSADSALPYSMIFLGHEQTDALLLARSNSSVVSDVIGWVGGGGASALEYASKQVAKKYSKYIGAAGILLIVAIGTYETISWIDTVTFNAAMNNCTLAQKKISITRTMTNGWPTNIYSAWNSDYVGCSPYEAYNPVFKIGVYDL